MIRVEMIKSSVMQIFYHPCLFYCFNYKMVTRQLNIKNRTYHHFNDLINMLKFEAGNLKLDKKNLERS